MRRLVEKINGWILPGTPWNPKLLYSTGKALWKRALRDGLGIDYGADRNSLNLIVHNASLLICGIPKAASTTLKREVFVHRVLGNRVEFRSAFLGDLLCERPALRDYYRVAFVRNPWSRVVSLYNSKIYAPRPSFVRTFYIRYAGLRHGMPFEEFVEWLCLSDEGSDEAADRHWLSQHRFLRQGDSLLVDRIARMECLNEEWADLCERSGVEAVPLGNYSLQTTEGGRSYRRSYDEHTRDLVGARYADDIVLLGYEF